MTQYREGVGESEMNKLCSGCGCIGFHTLGCPYLGATAWSLQNEPAYKEAQVRIQELEDLVREMGLFVKEYTDGMPMVIPYQEISKEILSRPQVKTIMEKKS